MLYARTRRRRQCHRNLNDSSLALEQPIAAQRILTVEITRSLATSAHLIAQGRKFGASPIL
jgi:hypothetical protein